MQKHLWVCWMVIVLGLTSTQSACATAAVPAEAVYAAPQGTRNPFHMLPGQATPALLPTAIPDAQLLEGWLSLYNRLDPVPLWDGSNLTGRDLAQFVLEQAIPVVWDEERVCDGGSCSQHYCREELCTYGDGTPNPDPIYISLSTRDQPQRLVATLAHEIYHRLEPFGPLRSTRFEEYWAYKVGASLSGAGWPDFAGVDPLDPAQLVQWFKENGIHGYYRLQYYPAGVTPLAQPGEQRMMLDGINR